MSAQDDKNRAEAQKRDAQNEINQHNSEKAKAENQKKSAQQEANTANTTLLRSRLREV